MTANIKENNNYCNHPSYKSSEETKPPLRIDRNSVTKSTRIIPQSKQLTLALLF